MKAEITVLLVGLGLVLYILAPVPFSGIGLIAVLLSGLYLAWLVLGWVAQKTLE